MDSGTYLERAAVADREAQAKRLEEDAKRFSQFREETRGLEKHTVRAVNIGREIGLSFLEYHLPAGEEAAEVYFDGHYALRLKMSYQMFKWFCGIARRMEAPARRMVDAMPALQLTLFAAEFLALPERTETQKAHSSPSPYTYFVNSLRGLQTDLERRLSEAPAWDTETRSGIKEELHRTREWLGAMENKLESVNQ